MRVALGNAPGLQPDAGQQVACPRHGSGTRQAVHLRAEANAVLGGQAQAEAGVAVLGTPTEDL